MKQNTATNKLVLVGDSGQDPSFTDALCKTFEALGWTTKRVRDSHEIVKFLEQNPTTAMLVVDEEMPRISGTCVVQRLPRLGAYVPSAVIANKRIPESRVPLAFQRPVNGETIARKLCADYQVMATKQTLNSVAEFFKIPASGLAWVVASDSATGKAQVRTLNDPATDVAVSGSTVGKLTVGQVVQLSGEAGSGAERLAIKVIFTPATTHTAVALKPAA